MSRPSLTDNMAALFCAKPGEWLDVGELAAVGGICGWRTRVSECRTVLDMDIEWRLTRWSNKRKRSQYRYMPDSADSDGRAA